MANEKISQLDEATTLDGVQYAGIQDGRNVRVPQTLLDAEFMTPAEVAASYQPLDADLTAIAALTTTSFGRGLLTEASATTARTTLGVGEVFETIALAEAYAPATAPDTIQTRGGAAAGDGNGGLYVNNGTATGDLVITLSDGTTDAGYDLTADVGPDRLTNDISETVLLHRPAKLLTLNMSDTNGPFATWSTKIEALTDHAKTHHPHRDIVCWNGDMVSTGDGTGSGEDTSATLPEWLEVMRSFVSRDHLLAIAGNHEVDRDLDGSNPQWSADYFTYKSLFGRKLYYYMRRGNMISIHMGAVSRNGRGIIPDEIVDWCKRLVRDHQWCSVIEIHTHQPLGGSGLPNADTQGILESARFTDWLGEDGYRVDLWFSGHTGNDFSNPAVDDHIEYKGCMFVASTDQAAETYVSHEIVDGAEQITFKRWDVAVDDEPTKTWTVDLVHPIESAGTYSYDGRYHGDGIYDVRHEPLTVLVQPERVFDGPNWVLEWKAHPIITLGLTDLANDNLEAEIGPALDFMVPGGPSGYASGDELANNPMMARTRGFGGRIAAVRSGNGEYDWGAYLDLYAGLPSTDPHGGSEPTEGQNTEEQLKKVMRLGATGSQALVWDAEAEAEVFRWINSGVLVGRTVLGGSSIGTGFAFYKTGEMRNWMAGTGENTHVRFYNNADVSGAQVGAITTNGSATSYNTSSDATLKDDKGELTFDEARAVLDLIAFHNFDWKATGEAGHGVFAQELFEVYPNAVTPGGWFDEETGEPASENAAGAEYQPWAVDYSKLVTVIGRCVQGVMERQDALEAKVAKMESA